MYMYIYKLFVLHVILLTSLSVKKMTSKAVQTYYETITIIRNTRKLYLNKFFSRKKDIIFALISFQRYLNFIMSKKFYTFLLGSKINLYLIYLKMRKIVFLSLLSLSIYF